MLKLARIAWRKWLGTREYGSRRETALSCDEEHKPFIRAKRNRKNLPNSWTNTRWLPRIKNWKSRAKIQRQWEQHRQSEYELNELYDYKAERDELNYKLEQLAPGEWFNIDVHVGLYRVALKMVKENLIDGMFKIESWDFIDFGNKITRHKTVLVAVKRKDDVKAH